MQVGNYEQSRAYLETALALRTRKLGADHPNVASSLHNLGNALARMGDPAHALSLHRRSLAIKEKTRGADHPTYALTLSSIGEDLRALGRAAEALTHQERALQIFGEKPGEELPIGHALAFRGLALLDLHRRREAISVLEQAVKNIPRGDWIRAGAAFALARALEPRGPRSPRAQALAQEALETFTTARAWRERDQVADYIARGAR